MHRIQADGRIADSFPELRVEMTLSDPAAERFFRSLNIDLATTFAKHELGESGSRTLPCSATMRRSSKHERTTSPNVLGMLHGSDPKLRGETILLTAHLDHIGIRPSASADSIHNGAYDNAAGVATILEVARVVAALPKAPRRSLLFAAVTGEEKGQQGSAFLAENFPTGSGTIVANLIVDMPYLGFDIADIEGLGVEHSSLQGVLREAAVRVGLTSTLDSRPEQVRFIRSDQFSFVKHGIPALNLKPGSACASSECDGAQLLSDFLKTHYHQPSDDLELPFHAEGARKFVQVAATFVLMLADADRAPTWNEGDFFGEKFAAGTATPQR
jgi:Zn-dependent M28 family amino/carboxypeptidase